MKLVIVAVLAVVAVAFAAPQNKASDAQVLRSDFDQSPEGSFQYAYETQNGINAQAQGELKQVTGEDNKPQQVVVIRGSYSYADDQGQQHSLTYTADENGYRAESADIPVAPVARR